MPPTNFKPQLKANVSAARALSKTCEIFGSAPAATRCHPHATKQPLPCCRSCLAVWEVPTSSSDAASLSTTCEVPIKRCLRSAAGVRGVQVNSRIEQVQRSQVWLVETALKSILDFMSRAVCRQPPSYRAPKMTYPKKHIHMFPGEALPSGQLLAALLLFCFFQCVFLYAL